MIRNSIRPLGRDVLQTLGVVERSFATQAAGNFSAADSRTCFLLFLYAPNLPSLAHRIQPLKESDPEKTSKLDGLTKTGEEQNLEERDKKEVGKGMNRPMEEQNVEEGREVKGKGEGGERKGKRERDKEKDAKVKNNTMAELDEDLSLKLEGISGEGGNAGIEYEGRKAVGLKRRVRQNMFRII